MSEGKGGRGVRVLLVGALMALLMFCAGAAVPGAAIADDDDDDDDNGAANYQQCSQAGGGTQEETRDPITGEVVAVTQVCVITTSPGKCIQHATAPLVVQMCLVNQGRTTPPPTGTMATNNSLTVVQTADQRGAEAAADAPLRATQIVDGPVPLTTQGEQRNFGPGNNTAYITQVIKQVLASGIDDDDDGFDDDDNGEVDEDDDGEEDDDNGEENGPPDLRDLINQFQQAHQSVDLCQGGIPCDSVVGMSGRNRSVVYQSEEQFEFAANALEINQGQNVEPQENTCSDGPDSVQDDTTARICYTIKQYTSNTSQRLDAPANYSKLSQYNNQVQVARNAGDGRQAKGFSPDDGGLDHSFVQFTPPPGTTAGIALLISDQDEYQEQRKINSPTMMQGQFGNIRKGSGSQLSNPNSLVDLVLDKTQYQGEGPFEGQTGSARAFATTSGECVADLTVTQNGESEHAEEPPRSSDPDAAVPGDFCAEFVLCGDASFGEEFPDPPEGDNCVSSDDPCPPSTARDPETGLCEPVGCPFEICLTGTNNPGVLATEP
jgi:hypothetical protein